MGKPIPLGIGRVGKVGWKREVERERPLNHLSPRGLVGLAGALQAVARADGSIHICL